MDFFLLLILLLSIHAHFLDFLGSCLTSFKHLSADIKRHLLVISVGSTIDLIFGILPHIIWLHLLALHLH